VAAQAILLVLMAQEVQGVVVLVNIPQVLLPLELLTLEEVAVVEVKDWLVLLVAQEL
jgi:hypothetical protein